MTLSKSFPDAAVSNRVSGDAEALAQLSKEIEQIGSVLPRRLNADPEKIEEGLAKLVMQVRHVGR